MVSLTVVVVLFLVTLYGVSAMSIPKGYILDVTHTCGKSTEDTPIIYIVTDLHVKAFARCANGKQPFRATTDEKTHYSLKGSYFAVKEGCLFYNRQGDHMVDIAVMWGTKDVAANKKTYRISCTFNNYGGASMTKYNMTSGMVRPKELLINVGSTVPSTYISFTLQDVKKRPITGAVPIDKQISLAATATGIYRNYQIRPVCCFAIGAKNKIRYAILRSGCGDGMIFGKTEGFTTKDKSSNSPYFTTFYVEGDEEVTFECTFILCTDCNGSSCVKGNPSNIISR